jgi:hypothetical protein
LIFTILYVQINDNGGKRRSLLKIVDAQLDPLVADLEVGEEGSSDHVGRYDGL